MGIASVRNETNGFVYLHQRTGRICWTERNITLPLGLSLLTSYRPRVYPLLQVELGFKEAAATVTMRPSPVTCRQHQ